MTILTILMAIVNAALFFLYGKEHKRRIALEDEVADRKPNGEAVRALIDMAKKEAKKEYELDKLLDGSSKALSDNRSEDIKEQIYEKECTKAFSRIRGILEKDAEKAKPKAMTAPIVRNHPLANDSAMTAPIVKKEAEIKHKVQLVNGPTKVSLLPKIPRGYKRHDGKRVPKGITKKTMVSVIFRNGIVKQPSCGWNDAELWDHVIDDSDMPELDIIAYKVVKPKTMKRKNK